MTTVSIVVEDTNWLVSHSVGVDAIPILQQLTSERCSDILAYARLYTTLINLPAS